MFDFGWQEFIMVAFVLVLVVGPKDLPKVLRGISKITGQARQMAREFTSNLEEAVSDNDLKNVKSMVSDLKSGNLDEMARIMDDPDMKSEIVEIKDAVDVKSIGSEVKAVQKSGKDKKADSQKGNA